MANICQYRIKVRGEKEKCEAFVFTMPLYTSEYSYEWSGMVDGKYEIIFSGDCKWHPDSHTVNHENLKKLTIEDIRKHTGNHDFSIFWEYPLEEKSFLFDLEVWCCSIDESDVYEEDYVHYCCGSLCNDISAPSFVSFVNETICLVDFLDNRRIWCIGDQNIGDVVMIDDESLIGIVTEIDYTENSVCSHITGQFGNVDLHEFEGIKSIIKNYKIDNETELLCKISQYWKKSFFKGVTWGSFLNSINTNLFNIDELLKEKVKDETKALNKKSQNTGYYGVDVHFLDGEVIRCKSKTKVSMYDYVKINCKTDSEIGLVINVNNYENDDCDNEILEVVKHNNYHTDECHDINEDDWLVEEIGSCFMLSGYLGHESNLTFPSFIRNKPVIGVDSKFSNNCKNKQLIESIKIPVGYSFIDNLSFKNLKNLKKVLLPYLLERIGDKAFYGCSSLKKVILPPTIGQLSKYYENGGERAFENCSSLEDVFFLNKWMDIHEPEFLESDVFKGCYDVSLHVANDEEQWMKEYAKEYFKTPKFKFCSCYPKLNNNVTPGTKFKVKCSESGSILEDENGNYIATLYDRGYSEYGPNCPVSCEEMGFDDQLQAIAVSKEIKGYIGGEGFDLVVKLKDDTTLDDFAQYFKINSLHEYNVTKSDTKSKSNTQSYFPGDAGIDNNLRINDTFQTGKTVLFGEYLQTMKDTKSIEWIVLERDRNKVLLLSKYGLSCRAFDRTGSSITWENSGIRKWLNSYFLNAAFNEFEQKAIITSKIKAEKNEHHVGEGNDTEDKIFLLNKYEYERYVKPDDLYCFLTQFAASENIYFSNEGYSAYGGREDDGAIIYGTRHAHYTKNYAFWWLRSHGSNKNVINFVGNRVGSLNCASKDVAIRPAMWIDLNNKFFGGNFESEEQIIQSELDNYLDLLRQKYSGSTLISAYSKLKSDNPGLKDFFTKLESGYYDLEFSDIADIKKYLVKKGVMESIENSNITQLVEKIKEFYKDLPKPKTISQIEVEHPELKRQLEHFKYKSVEIFSMSLVDYFINEGILKSYEEKRQEKEDGGVKIRAMSNQASIGKATGRPISVNPDEIIEMLKARAEVNGPYKNMDELKNDNPELKSKLKTLANISGDLLGTSLGKYLKEKGIITKQK